MLNLAQSIRTEAELQKLIARRPIRLTDDGCIMTGPVRLSFAALDKPKAAEAGGKEKYQSALLFPHTNLGVLKDALMTKLKADYPGLPDYSSFVNATNKNSPVKDQGMKINIKDGGYEPMKPTIGGYTKGFMFINPKSMRQPTLFHVVRGAWVAVLPEEIKRVMYSGCWVEAKIALIKSTANSNPGESTGLQGLWKLADDSSFDGGSAATAAEGGDVGDAFEAEDPNIIPQHDTAPGSAGTQQPDGW